MYYIGFSGGVWLERFKGGSGFHWGCWAGGSVVECLVGNQEVGGSIPPQSTTCLVFAGGYSVHFFCVGWV